MQSGQASNVLVYATTPFHPASSTSYSFLPLQIPSLVLGPFGCGKTRALLECVKLLALYMSDARVLICTHSNSAADLYVENLHRDWSSESLHIHILGAILLLPLSILIPLQAVLSHTYRWFASTTRFVT